MTIEDGHVERGVVRNFFFLPTGLAKLQRALRNFTLAEIKALSTFPVIFLPFQRPSA